MRKLSLVAAIAVLAMLSASLAGNAFGHALTVVDSDLEHANPIFVVIGHTNEPTFGAAPGIHDGKHNVEVFLEDEATALPLTGANLTVDKYYFKDIRAFTKASSPNDATEVERGVVLAPVFGDAGHYMARQVQKDGIYGYRLYGIIDYFGVAQVPIDTTVFCSIGSEGETTSDTSKFNSEGWFGGFGCTDKIGNILFPQNPSIKAAETEDDHSGVQPIGLAGSADQSSATTSSASATPLVSSLQLLAAGLPVAAVGIFFGMRMIKQRSKESAL
ncbi:MAG: hypothetical protein MN733_19485 [Nitrososphaera sp.]|nr:hypothetical protein [Nitrososphaera sp.]